MVIDDSHGEQQTEQTCGGYKCDVNAYCDSSLGYVSSYHITVLISKLIQKFS